MVSRKVAGLGGKGSLGSSSILQSGDSEGKVIYPTPSAYMQHTYMYIQNTKHKHTQISTQSHNMCHLNRNSYNTHMCTGHTHSTHIFTCYPCHTDHKQHTRAHHGTHHIDYTYTHHTTHTCIDAPPSCLPPAFERCLLQLHLEDLLLRCLSVGPAKGCMQTRQPAHCYWPAGLDGSASACLGTSCSVRKYSCAS